MAAIVGIDQWSIYGSIEHWLGSGFLCMSDIASNTEPQKVGLPHVQNHRNIKYEASFIYS